MSTFIDEILADIDWRVSELANIKTIPIKYSLRIEHRDIHYKYAVPAIYAIWEGFVKKCFGIYSNHLNKLSIKRLEIALPILTHQIDNECSLNTSRTNFEAKLRMVQLLDGLLTDIIIIKPNVPTESNVNYKVLCRILEKFCIDKVSDQYEKGLDKLLRFRNTIAHGENSLIVSVSHIVEFVTLIENLMLDIVINVENCEYRKTYFK
jgi:hypothetical protein